MLLMVMWTTILHVQRLPPKFRFGEATRTSCYFQYGGESARTVQESKFKHGKEVTQEAEIQYLKQHLLSQALVHHKHVIHMTHELLSKSYRLHHDDRPSNC